MAVANKELAELDTAGMSLEDKRHAILNFFKVGGELARNYEVDVSQPFEISVFTGDIIVGQLHG